MSTKKVTNEEILELLYEIGSLVPHEIPFSTKLIRKFNRVEKYLKKTAIS